MFPFFLTNAYKKNNNPTNKANQPSEFFTGKENLSLAVETNSKEKPNAPFMHLNDPFRHLSVKR